MANPIVKVITSVTQAPTPSTRLKTGALISQGGTTLATRTYSLLTQLDDLTPLLAAPLSLTGITQAAGLATAVAATPHGITDGDTFLTAIAGAGQAAYNGTFLATATTASDFTFAVPSGTVSPATGTLTYTPRGVAELVAMATTFFAQGGGQSVYALELGAGEPATSIASLATFITANPSFFYAYLVPRNWDAVASYLALVANFEATDALKYFYTTTTTGTYTAYTLQMKDVFLQVEAPAIPPTEFSLAADFYVLLNYAPSSTNRVTQFEYSFVFGVTPYPTVGNAALLAELTAANISYIGTGAEGGISDAIVFGGKYADGNQVNFWYAIDWMQINIDLSVANAVINGSNNPENPLYFNQQGINSLQAVAASTAQDGISYGLVLNPVVQTGLTSAQLSAALGADTYINNTLVNADPFIDWVTNNPDTYAIGQYGGLTIAFAPQLGFDQIIFNVNASSFA